MRAAPFNGERPSYCSPLPRFQSGADRTPDADLAANYDWKRRFYGSFQAEQQFQAGGGEQAAAACLSAHF